MFIASISIKQKVIARSTTINETSHVSKVRDLEEMRDLLWKDIGIYEFK